MHGFNRVYGNYYRSEALYLLMVLDNLFSYDYIFCNYDKRILCVCVSLYKLFLCVCMLYCNCMYVRLLVHSCMEERHLAEMQELKSQN